MTTSDRVLVVAVTLVIFLSASLVSSQSFAAFSFSPIGATTGNCPSPVVSSNAAILCPVGSGSSYQMYVSYNGGAYAPLTGAANGVASWNGRTGVVTPAANDYTYAQLASKPTTINCGTASHSNTGLVASSCVIQ